MWIANLRMRSKIALVVVMLLMPITLLAWLFVQQSFKDIWFADKERDGTAYLQAAWPIFAASATRDGGGKPALAPNAASATDLRGLAQRFDNEMATAVASGALLDALAAAGWPDVATGRDETVSTAIARSRDLIIAIADGSNLTLDPDLDSYYLMDLVTTKLPEALDVSSRLSALAQEYKTKATLSDDEKEELAVELGKFSAAVAGAAASIGSAFDGNADGSARAELGGQSAAFAAASADFAAILNTIFEQLHSDDTRPNIDIAALIQAQRTLVTAGDAFWRSAAIKMDDLLAARTSGFLGRLWTMLGISGAVVLAALGFAFFVARQITRPLAGIRDSMDTLAAGSYDIVLPGLRRGDEVGEIARTLDELRKSLADGARLREEQEQLEVKNRQERIAQRHRLAQQFEAAVGEIVAMVSSASAELEASATTLSQTAEATETVSLQASNTSQHTSSSVQAVAGATEELSASVGEIGQQVDSSSRIAREAVEQAKKANMRIGDLSKAAARIGDVLTLITDVAEQTNLLALNATIEAARAGEAGKGFAVVASEVKELAGQTAKATEEIGKQIEGMRLATQETVSVIGEIGGTIDNLANIASVIASAVQQQGSATQEISASAQQASSGTSQMASSIDEVSQNVGHTRAASEQVLTSARSLSQQSGHLQTEVDRFLASVRAA